MKSRTRQAVTWVVAAVVFLVALLLAHYQVWLRSFTGVAVTIEPGKWVWVECRPSSFKATIEALDLHGITIHTAQSVQGLPCAAVGIASLGGSRYFLPFQTVLLVEAEGRIRWKNPFSI